jgi:signal transduction histidine kinase
VNTPLAVISSYAQMLGKQLRSDEATHARLQPILEKITQQTFRASEIANGLLNFSRMGTVEFNAVDMNAMVRDTVLLLEHQMRSAGIAVTTELSQPLPTVLGNRGKLQQVLVNLVLNAKDALQDRPGGQIHLSTLSARGRVQLSVEDNGAGMPADVLRKIYDPFFTTKSNPREGHRKGTGLGLAVTYGIVQEHSGTIEVSSNVGEGTVFRLEFPTADASAVRPIEREAMKEDGRVIHV